MKNHLSAIIIATAIVLATIIHAFANRYTATSEHDFTYVVDKWTGHKKSGL